MGIAGTVLALVLAAPAAQDPAPSPLWGAAGEAWSPAGRIPDFSWAGFGWGAGELPSPPVVASVRDFGAAGDGVADDTRAFQDALDRAPEGAVLVPAGRYRITDVLAFTRSRIVLRGEGPGKSVLWFPKPLNEIRPNWGATTSGRRTSNYSWGGGFLQLKASPRGRVLGPLAERASRGSRRLRLAAPPDLRPGDVVELRQEDSDGSLVAYLYAGQAGDVSKLARQRISFVSPVEAVEGPVVTLARALRTDADPRWKAGLRTFEPGLAHCGVEGLTFEFPPEPYAGHFTEAGWNPLAFQGAAHCWGRDLEIVNGDSGPYLGGSFCTLRKIVLAGSRPPDREGLDGHHGITAYGDDNLVEDFVIRRRYVHDLTVEHSAGNVFRRGAALDLSLDHHKKAPHANLFTDLDAGEGTRLFRCGGGDALGRNSGAWGTFWGIRSKRDLVPPPASFGPDLLTFVGLRSSKPAQTDPGGRWWEPAPPERLVPRDLFEAQRAARRAR